MPNALTYTNAVETIERKFARLGIAAGFYGIIWLEVCKIPKRSNMGKKSDFVVVKIVQGEARANIIRAHLESEGIPVYLKYESAGIIYGITADGIGEVKILVPQELAEEAKQIIEPQDAAKTED
jgi:hypothetical protein